MAITSLQVVTGYYDNLGTPNIATAVTTQLSAGWIPHGAPGLTDVYGQVAQVMVKSTNLSATGYTVATGNAPMAPDTTWNTLGDPLWIESDRYLQAYSKGDQVGANIDLANQVDGVLPIANGGTGVNTQSAIWPAIRPTGPTPLAADPVSNMDAVTKQWAVNNITARTVPEVARATNVADDRVIISSDLTTTLNNKTVLFNEVNQKIYGLPTLPSGATIVSVNNNQLTYNPGNVTVTLLDAPDENLSAYKALISSSAGASNVGTPSGTVAARLDNLTSELNNVKNKAVTSIVPPCSPAITQGVKAVTRVGDGTNDFYVISNKASGKPGNIAVRVTNAVSPSDSSNYGGASPYRPSSVENLSDVVTAKLAPLSKSSGVTLSTLTVNQINTLYGVTYASGDIFVNTGGGDYNLSSPQVYNIPNAGTVTYSLHTASEAFVRFGCSNGASNSVTLSVSRDASNWVNVNTVNTQYPPSGMAPIATDVHVQGLNGQWYLRVTNNHTNPVYLVGLNFKTLGQSLLDVDNIVGKIVSSVDGGVGYYFAGTGATEFAAKELSTGKFFGTYHGGHSDFVQRLRLNSSSYNLDSSTVPALTLSRNVTLHSASSLNVSSSRYNYVASTQFGDGVTNTQYAIEHVTGPSVLCERIYTHMATTARNFSWIHLPVLLNKTDDGDVPFGQSGFVQQFRATDTSYVNCYFSQVNVDSSVNGYGGGYISFQNNYNKQYYGPAFSSTSGVPLTEGVFTTCKEFF